ncbi:hypothetical protein NS226_10535 [Aureimonas ureilytica]|uniref:HTH lysR-type domain-containing protein n=1 Tax=Aureimonas ureilytica TaxID=401562 RepID=A0A175R7Q2_9HYPH|nr:LysR family transcriptional regulator [Aureimonas ureilytica]KTQ95584.1 hypothetical protein NS226_10535 [Aureimonas ureilytica]
MNTKFLETLIWVSRLRSFSNAAEKLCTTQAAISNRIATLERDLGVQLFERDLRSVSLTPAGERALSYAEAIVRLTAELKLGLLDRHTVRGRVSVGTIDSIVYAWLPAFLETVKSTYPDVNVDLTVDTSLNISRMMLNGEVDLALIAGPVLSQGYRNLDLCSYDCVWVAAPRLQIHTRQMALVDLIAHPIFAFSRGSQPHQRVLHMIEEVGLDPQLARILTSNSLATITRMVREGMGVALLPDVVVQEMIENEELVTLDVHGPVPRLHFHAVYREDPGNLLPTLLAQMAVDSAAKTLTLGYSAMHNM